MAKKLPPKSAKSSAKLKVYRMAVGFHDAYIAAASQKAAIEAWGSDKDVFQRGQAEIVTDEALTAEPLARPGEIVKRLRGSAAEQIAALGADEPEPRKAAAPKTAAKPAKLKPRLSRAKLDEAEAALAEAERAHDEAMRQLRAEEAALAARRRALEKAQADERAKFAARRDKEQSAYDAALQRWRVG